MRRCGSKDRIHDGREWRARPEDNALYLQPVDVLAFRLESRSHGLHLQHALNLWRPPLDVTLRVLGLDDDGQQGWPAPANCVLEDGPLQTTSDCIGKLCVALADVLHREKAIATDERFGGWALCVDGTKPQVRMATRQGAEVDGIRWRRREKLGASRQLGVGVLDCRVARRDLNASRVGHALPRPTDQREVGHQRLHFALHAAELVPIQMG